MTSAYCIRCQRLKEDTQMKQVFHTGFIRIQTTDYPMGICTMHVEANQHSIDATRKIAN